MSSLLVPDEGDDSLDLLLTQCARERWHPAPPAGNGELKESIILGRGVRSGVEGRPDAAAQIGCVAIRANLLVNLCSRGIG